MKYKMLIALLVCCLNVQIGNSQPSQSHFAQFAMFSTAYGADNDWVGDRQNLWEHAYFWDQRVGISLTRRLFTGVLVQIIRAGNYEQAAQTFYTAGLWGRYYLIQPFRPEGLRRWGLYFETGLQNGNYAFENRDFIQYYEHRPGLFYYQGRMGGELRIWKSLSIETALQIIKPTSRNWDQHGTGYFSLALNWHPQRR